MGVPLPAHPLLLAIAGEHVCRDEEGAAVVGGVEHRGEGPAVLKVGSVPTVALLPSVALALSVGRARPLWV
jgi:hypothetical protein